MTPAATSTRLLTSHQSGAAGVVARKLARHAAGSRTPLQRPLQCLGARRLYGLSIQPVRLEPVSNDLQILVLRERVEGNPHAKAFGQRNLFLDGLARMNLATDVSRLLILVVVFRHQVPTVRGGVDQYIVGQGRNRTV